MAVPAVCWRCLCLRTHAGVAMLSPMSLWPAWMRYTTPLAATDGFSTAGIKTHLDAAGEVMTAVAGITLRGPAEGVVWRGQADESWRLVSKAGRHGMAAAAIRAHEEALIKKARKLGVDDAQRMGDWEILARLRHHGAVTRLIDCTTDPFVALWFLCDDDSKNEDGVSVRDLDGVLLALRRAQFNEIDHPYKAGTYSAAFDGSHEESQMLYSTPPIDARIAAQRGVFVFHSDPQLDSQWPESELGSLTPPSARWQTTPQKYLDALCGPSTLTDRRGRRTTQFPTIIAVTVKAELKPIILDMLEHNFGFTRDSMFPDFAGLGQYSSAVGI